MESIENITITAAGKTQQVKKKLTIAQRAILLAMFARRGILNTAEAAVFLNISESYVCKLGRHRKIHRFRFGGRSYCYHKKELVSWFLNRRTNTKLLVEAMNKINKSKTIRSTK